MKKKRKTSKTLGAEVAAVRNALGLSQGELAQKLGVGRSAISACEIGRIVLAPPALLMLAEMAPGDEQKTFFLEQAGLSEQIIAHAAEVLFHKRTAPPLESEVVRVGPLAGSEDDGELLMPRSRIPNPNFTFYVVGLPHQRWLALAPGVIVLDTKDAGSQIAPFWHDIVLIKTSENPYGSPEFIVGKVHPPAYVIDHRTASQGSQSAVLAGSSVPEPYEGLHLGMHAHEDWGKPEFHKRLRDDPEFALQIGEDIGRRAYREMTTLPGVEIVGKVIAWFPHPIVK